MENVIEISVVIPIFNRAYCLKRCLDSVLNQSFQNWECLLVDDGSTDDSLSVCFEYQKKDRRFKAYHQVNKGVSIARNLGIDEAKGKYIAFIDSDDWVDCKYLELLHLSAGEGQIPLCSRDQKLKDESIQIDPVPAKIISLDMNSVDYLSQYFFSGIICSPCSRLYDRELLNRIPLRFVPSLNYGEDTIFNCTYFKHIGSIKGVSEILYHVIAQDISLTNRSNLFLLPDWVDKFMTEIIDLVRYKKMYGIEMEQMIGRMSVVFWKICISNIYKHPQILSLKMRYHAVGDIIKRVDRKNIKGYLTNNIFEGGTNRLIGFLMYYRCRLFICCIYEMKRILCHLK